MSSNISESATKPIDQSQRAQLSSRSVNLALVANILLALLKTTVGIYAHSSALLADGINSTSDVVYNTAIAIFMRASRKPADDDHPYGHSQFESIGALVIAAFIITAAFTIFWNSVQTMVDYLQGAEVEAVNPVALYVALFTILLKGLLYIYTSKAGKKTNNPTVIALSLDHRNDIFSATAVVIGTLAAQFGYAWADPLAGSVVAIFFLMSGVEILRDSTDILMDTVPGQSLDQEVRALLKDVPGLEGIEQIQAHRFGQYLVMNITIFVCGDIKVREGHEVAEEVERRMMQTIDYLQAVHVHYHPKPGS
ncbi:MAG: cation diffusion facilitator family transporter [Anaerolineaceae bacterium]|jgi:cation diffusion facilitator family transporter|nr:cation diffusion facilitator family transporter [Anaerolineaceae bacterium]MDD4043639.1 cation diffusion facilitator family transporter [Anaerolineaceae bacterium]MDD4577588.1 cation diffusion facilitator family transporter [Anaerolineaceae bacterium]